MSANIDTLSRDELRKLCKEAGVNTFGMTNESMRNILKERDKKEQCKNVEECVSPCPEENLLADCNVYKGEKVKIEKEEGEMFISIDCDSMKILHKHKDLDVICNLAWIEHPDSSILITSYDIPAKKFLPDLTRMELRLLFLHTTGQEAPSTVSDEGFRRSIKALADCLPASDVNKFEVDRQAAYLATKREPNVAYSYVKNSTVPCKAEEGLEKYLQINNEIISLADLHNISQDAKFKPDDLVLNSTQKIVNTKENPMTENQVTQTEQVVSQAAEADAKAEAKAKAAAEKAEAKAKKEAEKAAAKEAAKAAKEAAKAEKAAAKEVEKKPTRVPLQEQNGARRPGVNTTGGRIWQVMDDMAVHLGRAPSIAECIKHPDLASDIEPNVRSIYARWRKFNGISGRIEAPKKEEASEKVDAEQTA